MLKMVDSKLVILLNFILLLFFSIAFGWDNSPPKLSTLDLINEDFQKGEIDYETSLLYKMYSIHCPEKLEERFRVVGAPPLKSATPIYLEIKWHWDQLSRETQELLLPFLARPTEDTEPSPGHPYRTDATFYVSPNGYFKIWYVTTTEDAPDTTDIEPADGIPDWINKCADYFDDCWAREVVDLGYKQPKKDGIWYPQGEDYGGDDKYDVYVQDLGGHYYGYAVPEYVLSSNPQEASSYIVVNNDYSDFPGYGDHPFDALKVTAAHEFFHAIQFTYDVYEYEGEPENAKPYWMEITAVWMEDVVYDYVNDYVNYLHLFFDDPEQSLKLFNRGHEYGSCVWAIYLSERFGRDIIKQIWTKCGEVKGDNVISATDYVLNEKSSSFQDAFGEFVVWNYFTDKRADPENYYSEGGDFGVSVAIARTHSVYPVESAVSPTRPASLGSNYIKFIPEKRVGGLRITFDGEDHVNWRVSVIGYGGSWSIIKQFDLDQYNFGQIQLANWEDFSQIVLIASVVSETEGGGTYSYSATYDSTLNNLPKLKDISIIPNPAHVVQGNKKQFMVRGYDANGDTITAHPNWFNWGVIGDIGIFESPGYFNAVGDTGKGKIVASRDGMVDTALIIVTESPLTRIKVTPDSSPPLAVGTTQQFEAAGFDRDSLPIPIDPIWEVKGNAGAIDQGGLFTATKKGSAEIVAKVGLISGSARINVTSPDPILSQSYPNPFKLTKGDRKVYFPLILPEDKGKVCITIFTISGERVKEINLGKMERDDYRDKGNAPSWDGKNEANYTVAEGIYLYRFQADDYTAVKKMAVIRE